MSEQPSIWKREIHLTRRGRSAEKSPVAERPLVVWPPPELEPEPEPEHGWQTPKREDLWVVPDLEPDTIGPVTREAAPDPAPAVVRELAPLFVEPEPEPASTPDPVGGSKAKRARGVKSTKIVGLRIGSSQLSAALVSNHGSAELLRLASAPLQRGIVTAGEVRDPEALAKALKRFFAQNKLPRRGVRLGVATNRIGVRVIDVPVAEDPKLLANAIRFRAHEVVPIPLAEAVLDHALLDEIEGDDGERLHRVLLVFAHRELVDGYLDACKRAGVKLLGIDFDAFALLRALSGPPVEPNGRQGALVAVAIGHERTIFAVSDGSVCDFARVLDWGGASLDAALVRALNLEPERAEQVRKLVPLTGASEAGGLSPLELEAARAAICSELQVLARELLSSLQFYQSRPGSLDIGEVLLTGGTSQLAGIETELGRQLGVTVRIGDPLRSVTTGKLKWPADAASLGIAIGLGIEG
ncbi:MAG TPA: type IV pilus assembly protein PilM [Gaiellaceae bacterium]|nr:type IV pilus assembly protein PilM [Gaiellaceae bacterium]